MIINNKNCPKYIFRCSENKFPNLFLMIHGYGSNEKDLFNFSNDISKRFFIVSIQGFYKLDKKERYSWYNINFSNKEKFVDIFQAKNSAIKISFFINKIIKKYKLNTKNVWICGFSQGAILSYAIAAINKKIKNVISLSGYLEKKILPEKDFFYKKINFFISHGKNDNVIPINLIRESILHLKKGTKINLFYKEYDTGHTINELNYKDLIKWINEKDKNFY